MAGTGPATPLAAEGRVITAPVAALTRSERRTDTKHEGRIASAFDDAPNCEAGRDDVVEQLGKRAVIGTRAASDAIAETGAAGVPAGLAIRGMDNEAAVISALERRTVEARVSAYGNQLAGGPEDPGGLAEECRRVINVSVNKRHVDSVNAFTREG